VREPEVEAALAALETEGFVMRGRFTPRFTPGTGAGGPAGKGGGEEWCERRLLARIHRHTLERLRREIEPVEPADFLRFLLDWHHLAPAGDGKAEPRPEGVESLPGVLDLLEGFEAPAAAWEGELLPARMAEYDPLWLDALCLSGRCVWGRITPPVGAGGGAAADSGAGDREGREGRSRAHAGPVRATPIALMGREALPLWAELGSGVDLASAAQPAIQSSAPISSRETSGVELLVLPRLSTGARAAYDLLRVRGACFFGEIAAATGLLQTQLESAIGELVATGLVTADSFTGLRALLVPAHKRPPVERRSRRGAGSVSAFRVENAGRWSVLARGGAARASGGPPTGAAPRSDAAAVTHAAWTLLRRYGVVCRRILERESLMPPWRDLLPVLRRLEARGEIRGGRFVNGFSGEQFALPDAIGRLRAIRREPKRGTLVSVSAADPLNLVGIATPGERVPALAGNRVLWRDGEPIAVYEGRQTRFMVELPPAERWQAQSALVRRKVAPRLKAYLGRSA
jgi:ATP-dependent Lhr-like helicase